MKNVRTFECFGTSDHAVVSFNVISPTFDTSEYSGKIYLFKKANWRLFAKMLLACSWPTSTTICVDDLWNIYLRNILMAAAASIPMGSKRAWRPTNSSAVRSAFRRHRRLYSEILQKPSFFNDLRLRSSSLKLNALIRRETCKHEHVLVTSLSDNPKQFWSYVKSKTASVSHLSAIKDSDGLDITDPYKIAECFSAHFGSVFGPPTDDYFPSCDNVTLCNVPFSTDTVHMFLKSLPSSTTFDPDGLCYMFLKKGGLFLACKLTHFFKRSLQTGCIPSSWKNVRIIPVHKSGPRDCCSNYRPIANTSCASRVMERIISKHILQFTRDRLNPSQHGFLTGRSIETAGIEYLDMITASLDNGCLLYTSPSPRDYNPNLVIRHKH